MARKHIDVVVSNIRQMTPRIREFQFTAESDKPVPAYGPGAHIELHTGDDQTGPLVRHYSLLGGTLHNDDRSNTYRIAVQREDRAGGSAFIHANFEVGTKLRVSAPINNFPLDRRDEHSLLLAGGIGITPIFAMARSLARRNRSFTVMYAGRDPALMAYHDELAELAGSRARFHYSGPDDSGKLDLEALLRSQPLGTTAYVCGPGPMVAATHSASQAAGWSPEQVRSELFGVGRTGGEMAFEVELRRSKRVINVGKDVSILDALMAAKVDVLWDCRRGECGLCPQSVISADGAIDHRDRYLSEEERQSGAMLCICVSRIRGKRIVLDA